MTEFELLSQVAANAANVPNAPQMIELPQSGFRVMRNARLQRAPSNHEFHRATRLQRAYQR